MTGFGDLAPHCSMAAKRQVLSDSASSEIWRPGSPWPKTDIDDVPTRADFPAMRPPKTRIMYVESKSGTLNGPARIGRVTFSKTGKSITYGGRTFQSLKGRGFKANYFDVETGEEFWISGPRKDGQDRLYPESTQAVEVDADVAEEYWRDIRGLERAPA